MELLVDIGNTRIKWCLLSAGTLTEPAALCHAEGQLAALQAAWSALPRPDAVRVASVAGAAREASVVALARDLWGIGAAFAQPRQQVLGLTLAYVEPERLGVDRWLAMLAARRRGPGPALVVDCGTAVTLDALDTAGNHLGGLILPGLGLLWSTLFEGTGMSRLPFRSYSGLLGTDTGECIAAGALQAVSGMIDRVRTRLGAPGRELRLVLTGGDAEQVAGQLAYACEQVPELVLEGLALLSG